MLLDECNGLCIKRLIYWTSIFLIAFAVLAFAFKTVAAPSPHVDYYDYTITKNDGFNFEAYDAYLEQARLRALKAKSYVSYTGKTCAIRPGVYVPIEWSCVCWARDYTGINVGSIGYAKYHPVNSTSPSIGALVVFNGSGAGHIAVVTNFTDTTISIIEANYIYHKVGTRTIPRSTATIKGYYIR